MPWPLPGDAQLHAALHARPPALPELCSSLPALQEATPASPSATLAADKAGGKPPMLRMELSNASDVSAASTGVTSAAMAAAAAAGQLGHAPLDVSAFAAMAATAVV